MIAVTWPVVRGLAGRAVRFEVHLWLSLYRWVRHRGPVLRPGEHPYPYVGAVQATIVAFILVSAVEVPIAHVVLGRWPTVQALVLVVGVQGLLWMVALLVSLRMHPHLAGPEGLRLRYAHSVDVPVAWADVASMSSRRRSPESGKAAHVDRKDGVPALTFPVGGQTNVDVVLRRPVAFDLPSGRTEPVTLVRFYADDAPGLLRQAPALPSTAP